MPGLLEMLAQRDPRGPQGIFTRGRNIYPGNTFSQARRPVVPLGQNSPQTRGPTVASGAVARRLAARSQPRNASL